MACHTYLPPQEVVPAAGHEVAMELNDRGRLLVGGQLGESVMEVQGRIVGSTDSAVTLSVSRTVLMAGSSAVWSGENVSVPREGVRTFRIREFSRSRTMVASGAFVLGLVVVGLGISLIGTGNGRPDGGGPCTTNCNGSIRQ
jgi:hypothetical protein